MKKLQFLLLLFLVAFSPRYTTAAPGGNNLLTCVANACPDVPMSTLELASLKAAEIIDTFYAKRHKLDGFNGCVMVAKDGIPIYTGSYGYGDYTTRDTLTPQSTFQLASVSKTFTSTAILLLAEKNYLSLDDTLQKFFPEFPYHGITVKMLLCHRSGLPDYTYFSKDFVGRDVPYLTNESLLQLLIAKKPPVRCGPNRVFIYCNTNYALLASVIEHVMGVSYKKFMHDVIFTPLGMSNTFVYSMEDSTGMTGSATISYEARWRVWQNGIYDGVAGDKGIYSSVEDMLKWDNALRTGLVLAKESLDEAYKPRSLDRYSFAKERDKNYGYGWRMTKRPDKSYLIYHNGFWHGNNNVFARDISNGYTVIVLGNKSNSNNYWTQPVWEVLNQHKTFEDISDSQ